MNNSEFLATIKNSFKTYLQTSARSNKKLQILHGEISKDLYQRLNTKKSEKYEVYSLGFGKGKEKKVRGRYVDKAVDITVTQNDTPIAGVAVKYVMSNYSQNSNNYFENMLGETANIRTAQIPYFQIFIIPDIIPYFNKEGDIKKWEYISAHNLEKYIKLSNDNIDTFFHTPNKTLVFIVNIQSTKDFSVVKNKKEYKKFYTKNKFFMKLSQKEFKFGNTIIYNDYDKFMEKIVHAIKSI